MFFSVLFFLFQLLGPLSSFAEVVRQLEACSQSKILDLSQKIPDYQILNQFPVGLFLVKEIVHTTTEKGQVMYLTRKSMIGLKDQASESCFLGDPRLKYKSTGLIPVLLDLTSTKSIGDSFWNFTYNFDKKVGSLNTKRSLIPTEDYQTKLRGQGFEIQKIQTSHDEFELRLNRNHQNFSEKIVLIFDRKLLTP